MRRHAGKKRSRSRLVFVQISLLDIKQERKVQQMITTETESSSVIHGKSQIPGYHLSHFLFRISDRIRTPHAEKTHSTDGIPVACYRNQYLLRVCVLLCHRIIDAVLRDKIPVKEPLLHFFTQLLPLILLTLRPGSCNHLILIADTKQLSACLRRRLSQLMHTGRNLPDRRIFFQNNLPVPICKNLQRLRFPYLQRPPYLLRNHHPPELIDSSYNSCSFHKLSPRKYDVIKLVSDEIKVLVLVSADFWKL